MVVIRGAWLLEEFVLPRPALLTGIVLVVRLADLLSSLWKEEVELLPHLGKGSNEGSSARL